MKKTIKILVTGLALSRNLGGPAMALTLVSELNKRFDNLNFTFAVSPYSFEQERKWANHYDMNVVKRDNIVNAIYNNYITRLFRVIYRRIRGKHIATTKSDQSIIHKEYMDAYKATDIVINMSGVTYVGDQTRAIISAIGSYSDYYYARNLKKIYIRFIQSFGPFKHWYVSLLARNELNKLDFIAARGKITASYCKQIVSQKDKVLDFPDIAILLPLAPKEWLDSFLIKYKLISGNYIVLCPSSVMYNLHSTNSNSLGNNHLLSYELIINYLISKGNKILLLPHMYSDNKRECDREISYKIVRNLKNYINIEDIQVITEDIDPMQAKAIISNSSFAIVSRYHALVAALSSSTPVISIGWNEKYKDLMDYYQLDDFALDARILNPDHLTKLAIEKYNYYSEKKQLLEEMKKCQVDNEQKVQFAFDLLEDFIKRKMSAK